MCTVFLVVSGSSCHSRCLFHFCQPPLRPRGDGMPEDPLLEPLKRLEDAVIDYMKTTRGAVLHARWPMSHAVPDTAQCLTDPVRSLEVISGGGQGLNLGACCILLYCTSTTELLSYC